VAGQVMKQTMNQAPVTQSPEGNAKLLWSPS